jgi:hypothetical protein
MSEDARIPPAAKVPTDDFQENLDAVTRAMCADADPDQRRIAEVGVRWLAMILRKNHDYGSSVWKEPILTPGLDVGVAIRVRMSDKVSRLRNLLKGIKNLVETETIDDTFADLGAYCLLYLTRPKDDA